MKTIIITGIAKGLGYSMYSLLSKTRCYIVGIDKESMNNNNETLATINNLTMNLSEESLDLSKINNILPDQTEEIIFINNAGIIKPIGKVGTIQDLSIVEATFVNFISPMRIANIIKSKAMKLGVHMRIINISTGAANKPFPGWSMYCSTKCGIKMFFDCIDREDESIIVHHIDPGVMDTGMQQLIRDASFEQFPLRDKFVEYKSKNLLQKPEDVARNILTKEGLL